jgi:ethanolamine ammonia-lyase small subunit
MNINELTRPKIGKRVTNTAFDYFRQRHPYNKSLSSKLPNSLSTNDIEARMNAIADVDDTLTSNLEKM